MSLGLDRLSARLSKVQLHRFQGRVTQVIGNVIEAELPVAPVGSSALVNGCPAEVIGFREKRVLLMPLERLDGISNGDPVTLDPEPLSVPVGDGLLGRVIDPLGRPMDGRSLSGDLERRPMTGRAPDPLSRKRISAPMESGIRARSISAVKMASRPLTGPARYRPSGAMIEEQPLMNELTTN